MPLEKPAPADKVKMVHHSAYTQWSLTWHGSRSYLDRLGASHASYRQVPSAASIKLEEKSGSVIRGTYMTPELSSHRRSGEFSLFSLSTII